MKLSKLWRPGILVVLVVVVATLAAACSGGTKAAQVLTIDANTVVGSEGAKSPQDICVVSSRFQPGQSVVWRIKVYDPTTGSPMDDKALDSLVVTLKDGQTFEGEYGPHPGSNPTDYFWSADWSIPQDYPTGSVPYQVNAKSKDGRTGTFSEFNVGPSLLTVVVAQ